MKQDMHSQVNFNEWVDSLTGAGNMSGKGNDPMDCIVHGTLQARILEWVTFPSPGDLPNPGIEPRFPTLQVDSLPAEPPEISYVREVFITVWASTKHRGHLVLMTIKLSTNYKALDDRSNSLHSAVPGQDKVRTGVTAGA